MTLKFKNRIAWFNTIAAAASTLLVFAAVYGVVHHTAYQHLDNDIREEQEDVFENLHFQGDSIVLRESVEWTEKEHQQVEVNPIFLQIADLENKPVFLSSNLKNERLWCDVSLPDPGFFNRQFDGKQIRLGQFPIRTNTGKIVGQLSVGVSLVESALLLHNLLITLLIAFPLLTLIVFLASSFAASRGIAPIHQLIKTAQNIDDQTIGTRLPLPARQDELYRLATTINELLTRIESSLSREKQVTANISHELRTPLAGIRGTLEVLLRKPREPEQYAQKIEYVLQETDRLNKLLEQLLHLSRLDAGAVPSHLDTIDLQAFVANILEKWSPIVAEKQTSVDCNIPSSATVQADAGLLEIIVGNLLSNALKYGNQGGKIHISWSDAAKTLTFEDDGPGISAEQLPFIFDRFYRTDASRNVRIPGTGIGLAIAKKLADLQRIKMQATSEPGKGAHFILQF